MFCLKSAFVTLELPVYIHYIAKNIAKNTPF